MTPTDYVKSNGRRDKAFEYLTRVAVETLSLSHAWVDYESCMAFVEYAAEYATRLNDVHALIGVLVLANSRYNMVITHSFNRCGCVVV